jgi:hypothetical protein
MLFLKRTAIRVYIDIRDLEKTPSFPLLVVNVEPLFTMEMGWLQFYYLISFLYIAEMHQKLFWSFHVDLVHANFLLFKFKLYYPKF